MPTRYQDGAAGSHGFGKPNRTCLPTRYKDGAGRSHGFGTTDPTCLRGIRTGLQDLTGSEHQIVYAQSVSGRGCRISRVRNIRSNMPTRYQVGVAGSHGLGTTDRTWLLGIRR